MLQLIWSHGWGFDTTFFTPLCLALPGYEHFVIDWGYFDTPSMPELDRTRPIIGIGHSLGFAKLFDLPFSYESVVSLGGFTHFCQTDSLKVGTPGRVLQRMLNRFQIYPQRVLQDFYRSCGFESLFANPSNLNTKLLSEDLERLMSVNINLSNVNYLALAARNDQICSLAHQQAMFTALQIMDGDHNFPMIYPRETAFSLHQYLS